jgi:hypothetical protein
VSAPWDPLDDFDACTDDGDCVSDTCYCLNCGYMVADNVEFCSRECENEYNDTNYGVEEKSPKRSEW